MTLVTRLEQWKDSGAITAVQYDAIAAMARSDRFSVFVELNTLLYLGVLALAGGISWTMTTFSARLGDAAILSSLTCVFCWSLLASCSSRSRSPSADGWRAGRAVNVTGSRRAGSSRRTARCCRWWARHRR